MANISISGLQTDPQTGTQTGLQKGCFTKTELFPEKSRFFRRKGNDLLAVANIFLMPSRRGAAHE